MRTVTIRGRGAVDVISRGHDVIVASRAPPHHGHKRPYSADPNAPGLIERVVLGGHRHSARSKA